jgi:hypothetical protein
MREDMLIRCHDCSGTVIYKETAEGYEVFHSCHAGAQVREMFAAKPAQEALCGTAGLAAISMNEATRLTATDAYLFEGRLLPEEEWNSLSLDSQEKLRKWFRLATERLQSILDESNQQAGQ